MTPSQVNDPKEKSTGRSLSYRSLKIDTGRQGAEDLGVVSSPRVSTARQAAASAGTVRGEAYRDGSPQLGAPGPGLERTRDSGRLFQIKLSLSLSLSLSLPRTIPHTVIVILPYLKEYFENRDKQYGI